MSNMCECCGSDFASIKYSLALPSLPITSTRSRYLRTLLLPLPEPATTSRSHCYCFHTLLPTADFAADSCRTFYGYLQNLLADTSQVLLVYTSRPCYPYQSFASVSRSRCYCLQALLSPPDLSAASIACCLLQILPLVFDHYPTFLQDTEQTQT